MDRHEPGDAHQALNNHVSHCNDYAERNKPWDLAKDESLLPRLQTVLGHLCESCAQLNVGHLSSLKLNDLRLL